MEKLKTVKKECKIEFEEKKSKFIGYVKPVFSKEEAEDYVKYIKSIHSDAAHNCSAYKINNNGLVRNYAKTAKLTITEAEIVDFVYKIDLIFEIPYEKLGELEKLLKDYEAEIIEKSFLEKIIFKVKINKQFYDSLENYPYINLLDI